MLTRCRAHIEILFNQPFQLEMPVQSRDHCGCFKFSIYLFLLWYWHLLYRRHWKLYWRNINAFQKKNKAKELLPLLHYIVNCKLFWYAPRHLIYRIWYLGDISRIKSINITWQRNVYWCLILYSMSGCSINQ